MNEGLAKIRHERSKKDFSGLPLNENEYVELAFKRARVCLWLIVGGTALGVIMILLAILLTFLAWSSLDEMGQNFLFIILYALLAATIIIGIVAWIIYRGNQFFVTNERVIQLIRNSLVSSSVNTISLSSIEDVSFRKDGILQNLFKYGTLRLATVGDETTYTFKYADVTAKEMEAISKLVIDAKEHGKSNDK